MRMKEEEEEEGGKKNRVCLTYLRGDEIAFFGGGCKLCSFFFVSACVPEAFVLISLFFGCENY